MKRLVLIALLAGVLGGAKLLAHHSFAAEFDDKQPIKLTGTLKKVEWTNPHIFIWVYVPNTAAQNGFDLYAFENGSPNVLTRLGWSKTTFAAGEQLTIEYWPLADGRTGGHFFQATRADGSVIRGAGGPRGVDGSLPPPLPVPAR